MATELAMDTIMVNDISGTQLVVTATEHGFEHHKVGVFSLKRKS
jgi:hypothetical protein